MDQQNAETHQHNFASDDEEAILDNVEGSDEGPLEVSRQSSVVIEKNDRSLSEFPDCLRFSAVAAGFSLRWRKLKLAATKNLRQSGEFHRWYKAGRLIVDPEWQRNYLWTQRRSARLIESFMMDIPVPVIYLARNDSGKYEVIDGLQRLTSVFKFFDNEFRLAGLEAKKEFEGKYFRELPEDIQFKLQDVTLRSFELAPTTNKDLLFVLFERLNAGGIALNRMELRNCIYRGKLNELIKNLTQDEDFVRSINQKGISSRMKDRELILRFLAFYERTYHKCKRGLGLFLNDFCETYQDAEAAKLKEFQAAFRKAMKAAVTVFGSEGFRLRSKNGGWSSRLNAAVFQVIAVSFTEHELSQLTRRADSIYEEFADLIASDTEWVSCVTSQTSRPQRIQYAFKVWTERLLEALQGEQPNDQTRLFSQALKKEMFAQQNTCAICNQEIRLLDDAALDHDKHYWRGGKTVPENARLVHRHCNLTRPL